MCVCLHPGLVGWSACVFPSSALQCSWQLVFLCPPCRCQSIDSNLKLVTQLLKGSTSKTSQLCLLWQWFKVNTSLSVFFFFFREVLETQVYQELLENQGNQEIQEAQYVQNNKTQIWLHKKKTFIGGWDCSNTVLVNRELLALKERKERGYVFCVRLNHHTPVVIHH